MALINCPECNDQVSDTPEACPHCGATISKARGSTAAGVHLQTVRETRKKLKV